MRIALLAAVLALGACATPCPPGPAPAGPVTARFVCAADEEEFTVVFMSAPAQAVVTQEGYPEATLPQLPAGSGYRYAAGGIELRGRGLEARITRPGAGERVCMQQTS